MDGLAILAFLGTAVVLTIAPGPDILFVIAQSMTQNKMAGIATALGLCTGLLVHIAFAAAGISAIIYQSSIAFSVVKYAGAAYLLYLAWQAFRDQSNVALSNDASPFTYRKLYKKGIIMNLLNPKVSLFFLALLPQFTDPTAGSVPLQMVLFGCIFLIQALLIFSVVSVAAHKTSTLVLRHPRIQRRLNVIQGTLFTVIGLQILFSRQ
ncbi:Threonine/homoserine/homoserine lactone efflux protein [Alteribacillus persepolensis]|uniref:Threonine/homoserine/homoserine lactone efflux protein n=1 Tax=Alteribacillus persepolensis TaxID=568899 RepID=A0A1G8KLW7_9BACI|nr:LysE family translocator [Alteribacillus persepolensis]SDI44427.1 Threonine/homoserine/homoserine lactone efflux protein [Alteribacillus persepolensis]